MKKKNISLLFLSLFLVTSCIRKKACIISSSSDIPSTSETSSTSGTTGNYQTIKFKVDDNTIKEVRVRDGESIKTEDIPTDVTKDDVIDSETGLKTKYEFAGWNWDPVAIQTTGEVQALFEEYYECRFVNDDSSSTQLGDVKVIKKGGNIDYTGVTPTKADKRTTNGLISYTFRGWNQSLDNINKPTEFKAEYSESIASNPQVTVTDLNGNTLKTFSKVSGSKMTTSELKSIFDSDFFDDEENKRVHYYDENDLWVTSEDERRAIITGDKTIVAKVYTITYEQNGTWPQSKVTDTALISKIEKEAASSSGTDNYIEVEGKQYYKDQFGTSVVYRKVEPIKWIKLDGDFASGATMISEKVLTSYNYYDGTTIRINPKDYQNNIGTDEIYPCSYQFSNIRNYLNNGFLTKAFVNRKLLVNTLVKNDLESCEVGSSVTTQTEKYLSNNTYDNVWLPSYYEVFNMDNCYAYFGRGQVGHLACSSRVAYNVDGEAVAWWLRTPYTSSDAVSNRCYSVLKDGANYYNYICSTELGIRPMIQFDLSKVLIN